MTKNNEKFWRWSKIVLAIILASVGLVYGYGKLNHRVETLEVQAKDAQKTKEIVIRIDANVNNLEKAIARIEGKIDGRK